jgi:hypothetical protein
MERSQPYSLPREYGWLRRVKPSAADFSTGKEATSACAGFRKRCLSESSAERGAQVCQCWRSQRCLFEAAGHWVDVKGRRPEQELQHELFYNTNTKRAYILLHQCYWVHIISIRSVRLIIRPHPTHTSIHTSIHRSSVHHSAFIHPFASHHHSSPIRPSTRHFPSIHPSDFYSSGQLLKVGVPWRRVPGTNGSLTAQHVGNSTHSFFVVFPPTLNCTSGQALRQTSTD